MLVSICVWQTKCKFPISQLMRCKGQHSEINLDSSQAAVPYHFYCREANQYCRGMDT